MAHHPSEQYTTGASEPRQAPNHPGGQVQWVHSYVTRDRVYSVYHLSNDACETTTTE